MRGTCSASAAGMSTNGTAVLAVPAISWFTVAILPDPREGQPVELQPAATPSTGIETNGMAALAVLTMSWFTVAILPSQRVSQRASLRISSPPLHPAPRG
jgi:hypothetical protein